MSKEINPIATKTTKMNLKKAKAIELWRETHGHISNISRSLGIARSTFYAWMEDPVFAQALIDSEGELNDEIRDVFDTQFSGELWLGRPENKVNMYGLPFKDRVRLKDFISNLLQTEREKLIEGMKDDFNLNRPDKEIWTDWEFTLKDYLDQLGKG